MPPGRVRSLAPFVSLVLAAAVPALSPVAPARAALIDARVVALSGTPAPGTALSFGNAFDTRDFFISGDGRIVFGAPLVGGPPGNGFWRWTTGTTTLLAAQESPLPGMFNESWEFFTATRFGMIASTGHYGLLGGVRVGGVYQGRSLWTGSGSDVVSNDFVAQEGFSVPDVMDAEWVSVPLSVATLPVFNGGRTAFVASIEGPPSSGVNSDNDSGVWTGVPGAIGLIARENQAMPGQPVGAKFNAFGDPQLLPDGTVAFTANSKLPVSAFGLYRWRPGEGLLLVGDGAQLGIISKLTANSKATFGWISGATELRLGPGFGFQRTVATIGQPSPDAAGAPAGANFTQFLHLVVAEDDSLVLLAQTADGRRGIWAERNGSLRRLARNSDPAPGTATTFLNITQMTANGDGVVCFEATLANNPSGAGWWSVRNDGVIRPLLLPGDQIEVAPGDVRTVVTAKGPAASVSAPSEYGTGADGQPAFQNANDLLLQPFFTNFTSAALVLVEVVPSLIVNHTGNGDDLMPGDGICDAGGPAVEGRPRCTLRAAIQEANALPGFDRITFDIPEEDAGWNPAQQAFVIRTVPATPALTEAAEIDATTQPGFAGRPRVVVDGTGGIGNEEQGFRLYAGNSTIRGFSIVRFFAAGIAIAGPGGNVVAGNYIGLRPSGVDTAGSRHSGVEVLNSPGNRIGGTAPGDGNVITSNGFGSTIGWNVLLYGPGATANRVEGNILGLAANGQLLPNGSPGGLAGVRIEEAAGNAVGGPTAAHRNVIGGNLYGVEVLGPGAGENRIEGNWIGLGADGSTTAPNSRAGVRVANAADTRIGGATPVPGTPPGNVISGNASPLMSVPGVDILEGSDGTSLLGNLVGTDPAGNAPRPNGLGVRVASADSIAIGGFGDQDGNVISGNLGAGVQLRADARGAAVRRNLIGLRRDLTGPLANLGDGVLVEDSPAVAIETNAIGGNGGHGVHLAGDATDSVSIALNAIGTDPLETLVAGNDGDGIRIAESDIRGTRLSSDGGEDANTIRHNGGAGLRLLGGQGTRVRGGSFFLNGGLGIDLGPDGPTPGDDEDADAGPNGLQNAPVLTMAQADTGDRRLVLRGVLAGQPLTTYRVDLYGSPVPDPAGFGEGREALVHFLLQTDDEGDAAFRQSFDTTPWATLPGVVAAVATDPADNSSEFSNAQMVVIIEDTLAAPDFIVNSTRDVGDLDPGDGACDTGVDVGSDPECTLRAALEEAAHATMPATIAFDIPGDGPHVVAPVTPLPGAGNVFIDGTSQPGYAGRPLVLVDGTGAGGADGLLLGGSAALLGLAIVNFGGNGLVLGGDGVNHVGLCAIGVNPATDAPAGNGAHGVLVTSPDNRIGGPQAAYPNEIAFNALSGVRVVAGGAVEISGNSIHDNGALGVDLAGGGENAAGVTANDPGDGDDGPNGLQNFPQLLSATRLTESLLRVTGTLSGPPDAAYTIEVFASAGCDASGHGEGRTHLGGGPVLADGAGTAAFTLDVSAPPDGAPVSATATDEAGRTSEFAACLSATTVPVALLSFAALPIEGGVRLEWSVADDGALLGFLVRRRAVASSPTDTGADAAADWSPITPALLAGAPDPERPGALRFRFDDLGGDTGVEREYLLEALDRSGDRVRLGPFRGTAAPIATARLRVAPNPARGPVRIEFDLPAAGPVEGAIFDPAGRLVARLPVGTRPAGRHALDWDGGESSGSPVAAGLYFLRLATPSGVLRERIVRLP